MPSQGIKPWHALDKMEHPPVLAQEVGPAFFGGVHEELVALVGLADQVIGAFRHGGGIPYGAYPDPSPDGMRREIKACGHN